jgi:hypothetical protein
MAPTGPKPGSTPVNVPNNTPMKQKIIFNGSITMENP